jgi:predicted negative regulator of RcsB-dependent stress response
VELLSEEEQAEALKAWVRRNGPFIVGAILLALAVNFGMSWWKGHGQREAELADGSYERVLDHFEAGKVDEALALIEALRSDHPKSPYVAAADLAATRVFVARNELDKAELRLKRVAGYITDPQLKPLVNQRLARVQSALGRHDEALATLGTTNQGAWEPAYAEARGDVLYAKGDHAGALREYEAARAALPPAAEDTSGVGQLIDLKINDLRAEDVRAEDVKP